MRLQKLSHILLPVLGIVIITFVSFFLMLGYVANDAYDATLKTETNILKAQLNQLATNLELTAEDNSVWNAAYENIHVNLNQEWLINNYGDDIKFFANIDSFMIYRADNTVKYTTSDVNQPTPE
ncbi:MAG: CHASE4 domain-containing protein, partial [Emcibacteraceae bacterium]|nr:CHASE4 domain-containing protein [Emcibacteraceae bacterium]